MALENLEAVKTSSEEAVKMALATRNIAVPITLLGKWFSAQYRERPKKIFLGKRDREEGMVYGIFVI